MTFLHLSLATLGGSFVAIPIVLHLLMRRRPRHLVFPALRFVQARRQSNQRKMRLRHWALLALRCAAIAVLALAVARPRVPTAAAGNWGLIAVISLLALTTAFAAGLAWNRRLGVLLSGGIGLLALMLFAATGYLLWQIQRDPTAVILEDAGAPVSTVLLYDVSPRMSYRHLNQTRLEAAQQMGKWLLAQLPFDSEVAVMDTASLAAPFTLDRTTAKGAIDRLATQFTVRALPAALRSAVTLVRSGQKARKEIYLFSDLTAASWGAADQESLAELLRGGEAAGDAPVMVYILDQGVERTANYRLGLPELNSDQLAGQQPLDLSVTVFGDGIGGTVMVQWWLEEPDATRPVIVDGQPLLPEQVLRGQQEIDVPLDGAVRVSFSTLGLDQGTHHGEIRLISGDGLTIDDSRRFTVNVAPPRSVLIVAGTGAESSLLLDVLSPIGLAEAGKAQFQCTTIEPQELAATDLSPFQAIALLDPPPLSVPAWRALGQYVDTGGGLALFLGRNAIPIEEFWSETTRPLIPGQLNRQWRAGATPIYLTLDANEHPILRGLRQRDTSIPWNRYPINKHWGFAELKPNATVIMRFGNGQPAILQLQRGQGNVITMTTPISDPLNVPERPPWNELPTSLDSWPYFVLTLDLMHYLSRGTGSTLNYEVGAGATISHDFRGKMQLFSPEGSWQDVAAKSGDVFLPVLGWPGTYRLRSADPNDEPVGCSANVSPQDTILERMDPTLLDELLGEDGYRVAATAEEIDRDIGESRLGREFFPWLLLAVGLLLALEYLLANRFYPPLPPASEGQQGIRPPDVRSDFPSESAGGSDGARQPSNPASSPTPAASRKSPWPDRPPAPEPA